MSRLRRRGRACLCGLLVAGAVAAEDPASCSPAVADLFPVQSWLPPPPPPVKRKPEPPKAPPLPFKYLGQLREGQSVALFLERGGLTHVVRAGDTVDGNYRLDSVTPTRATFTYLPLEETQHLTLRTRP